MPRVQPSSHRAGDDHRYDHWRCCHHLRHYDGGGAYSSHSPGHCGCDCGYRVCCVASVVGAMHTLRQRVSPPLWVDVCQCVWRRPSFRLRYPTRIVFPSFCYHGGAHKHRDCYCTHRHDHCHWLGGGDIVRCSYLPTLPTTTPPSTTTAATLRNADVVVTNGFVTTTIPTIIRSRIVSTIIGILNIIVLINSSY